MPLPKRPAPYLLAVLLLALAALVVWLYQAVTSASRTSPASQQPAASAPAAAAPKAPPPFLSGAASPAARPKPAPIDPGLQAMADDLHKPDSSPQHDLEILSQLLTEYSKAHGSNPIGSNADITEAFLGGDDAPSGRFFPRSHPSVRNGQITDRWGQPYWFHPNSGSQMEIRSAGPDKQLFTADDVVLNPSPPGLGATPSAQPAP